MQTEVHETKTDLLGMFNKMDSLRKQLRDLWMRKVSSFTGLTAEEKKTNKWIEYNAMKSDFLFLVNILYSLQGVPIPQENTLLTHQIDTR